MFDTQIKITLEPVYYKEFPRIQWGVNGLQHDIKLSVPLVINVDREFSQGEHSIEILFYNKMPEDSMFPVDKAVIIKSIVVEGLSTTKISQGIYYPEFPEPWATEQRLCGIDLFEKYRTSTYLGWNGKWVFNFSCPIYQWIHSTENLGFHY